MSKNVTCEKHIRMYRFQFLFQLSGNVFAVRSYNKAAKRKWVKGNTRKNYTMSYTCLPYNLLTLLLGTFYGSSCTDKME